MSRALPRLVALLATAPLTAAALVVAAPAANAAVPLCSTTPVYDFTVLGGLAEKLAVDTSAGQVTVCFTVDGAVGALVVRPTVGFTPPTVTQTTGTLPCTQPVFDSNQPVSVHISAGVGSAANQLLCLSLNGQTTIVSYGLPSVGSLPSVELWRSGTDDLLDYTACLPLLAEYDAGLATYQAWYSCIYSGPRRIL